MTDVELNMAVAEAAGIKITVKRLRFTHIDSGLRECVRVDGKEFNPVDDWNDAMEAAEKVGLFHPSTSCGRIEQVMGENGTEWSVSWFGGADGHEEKTVDIEVTKGPRALCEAIVAMKGGE